MNVIIWSSGGKDITVEVPRVEVSLMPMPSLEQPRLTTAGAWRRGGLGGSYTYYNTRYVHCSKHQSKPEKKRANTDRRGSECQNERGRDHGADDSAARIWLHAASRRGTALHALAHVRRARCFQRCQFEFVFAWSAPRGGCCWPTCKCRNLLAFIRVVAHRLRAAS